MCLYAIKDEPRHYLRLVVLSAMREQQGNEKNKKPSLPTDRPNGTRITRRIYGVERGKQIPTRHIAQTKRVRRQTIVIECMAHTSVRNDRLPF